ncbi:MAG TPA: hypothetical protein VG675_20340 [Bryobacteraceae bacterium]|nr:hypothetical protein [Bryobacteraceae bacterium]
MYRILMGALFCAVGAASLFAQTKTIDNQACHVTVPADWKPLGPHSAQAPGASLFTATVRPIDPDQYKMTVDMIKQGKLANLNAKVLDENAKRVLIQTEIKSAAGKVTTHYQVMTKASPGCQGSADFEDSAEAGAVRKIVESTTGAQ